MIKSRLSVSSAVVLTGLLVASGASAATKKVVASFPLPAGGVAPNVDYEALKKEDAEYKSRKLASNPEINEKSMSKELVSFRDRILNLKTGPEARKYLDLRKAAQEKPTKENARFATWSDAAVYAQALDDILAELDNEENFAKYEIDLKLMAYGVPMMRAMKGIVYRTRAWVADHPTVHSPLLGMVRQMMTAAPVYLPTAQSAAVGAYLAEPMDGFKPAFKKAEDFAAFIAGDLTNAAIRSWNRLNQVKQLGTGGRTVIVDNQLVYSTASFQDGIQRFQIVGVPEFNAMRAGILGTIAQLYTVNAYNYDDVLEVAKKTGLLFGIDGARGGLRGLNPFDGDDNGDRMEGAPMRDRVETLRKFPDFLTLRPKGKEWMAGAFGFLKASTFYAARGYDSIKNRSFTEIMVINPAVITAWNPWVARGEANALAVVKGPTPLKSAVTGEVTVVDLPAMFNNPPTDLKAFLPYFENSKRLKDDKTMSAELAKILGEEAKKFYKPTFRKGGSKDVLHYRKTVQIDGKDVAFGDLRNYKEGAAHVWDYALYNQYFKKGDGQALAGAADVKNAAKILSQTWGGGAALAGLIF